MSSNPGNAPSGPVPCRHPGGALTTGWLVPDRRIEHVLEHRKPSPQMGIAAAVKGRIEIDGARFGLSRRFRRSERATDSQATWGRNLGAFNDDSSGWLQRFPEEGACFGRPADRPCSWTSPMALPTTIPSPPCAREQRKAFRGYPVATIAYYGPDEPPRDRGSCGHRALSRIPRHGAYGEVVSAGTTDVRTDPQISLRDWPSTFSGTRYVALECLAESSAARTKGIDYPEGEMPAMSVL